MTVEVAAIVLVVLVVVALLVTLLVLWVNESREKTKAAWVAAAEQLGSRLETVGRW